MVRDEKLHTRLVEFVMAERVIDPVKPFTGTAVMVEVAATPAVTGATGWLAVIVKS
jgi:hypothetical protein